ncbi:MAG: MFS transporter [Candidatus Bathycorpusculaceae bacterium]
MSRFGLSRSQGLMLTLGFLMTLNMHLLLFSYSPLIHDIRLEMGISNAEAGLLFSICILTLMVLRVPWGMLCDRKGFKVTTGLALTLMGVFGLLRGFATDYSTFLASQFLLGAALSAVIPCLPKLVSAGFPKQKYGLATGICMAGFPVGDVLGLSVTPFISSFLGGWRQAFQLYGSGSLLLMLLWWRFAHENFEKTSERTANRSGSLRKNFAILLRVKEIWLLTGLYFCAAGCYDTVLVWLVEILQSKGVSPFMAALVGFMPPLGFFAASTSVGTFSDRLGLRKPFVLVLGLVSGPAIYLTGTIFGPALYVAAFLMGFCTVGVLTLTLAIPIELPRLSSHLSSALGLISSLGNASSFLLPTAVGQIKDATGTFFPAILMLAIVGECMFALGLALQETGRKGRADA